MTFKTKFLLHILAAIVCSVAASSCVRLEPARQPDSAYWLRTISLNIKAPCHYYVDGKSISQEKLIEELNVAPGTDMQRVRVLIKPDLDVQYSEVAQTITRLHEAGYIKIGLISADKE